MRNDRLTRFLAVCLKIQLNSSGAKKGNEISFLENEISKIKNKENYNLKYFYYDYECVRAIVDNNEILFCNKRGLLFLSAYFNNCLYAGERRLWEQSLKDVSLYIPEGIFEDKDYEVLNIEYFLYRIIFKDNDLSFAENLIYKVRMSFEKRLGDNSDVKWVGKIEGEDIELKLMVANNFLLKYRYPQINEISELVFRMDEIFIRKGDCYRDFKRIVDSYRTKKSNNKVGLAKFNMTIKSSNAEWLQNVSDCYGISRSDVINLIIIHRKELKLESFFEERKRMMFPE